MAKIVKITAGQPFTVFVPLVILNADGTKVAVDANTLTQVSVKAQNGANVYDVPTSSYEHFLVLQVTKGLLPVGVYDIIITAKLQGGREFRLAMQQAVGVMSWDWQTNWRDYIVGDHIELCDQPFIAGEFVTDAELEELKAELRAAIAEAEQAKADAEAEKEHYAEAVEQLDDLARQGDNPNATNTQILYDINHLVVPPPIGMAQESTLTAGITALQNAITALYGGDLTATLAALKTAIANISIDTTDLAKANALAAVQSDIDALQVLVGTTADTSTDATIFGKFAAVLAAVAGISGFATPTDVANAQTAIIAAMPSVSGLATETNATSNKQAILDAISALSIPTVAQIQNGLAKTSDIPSDYAKETTAQAAATDAAAAKTAAQGITGYALQGSGNATQTDIATAIGTPVSGQATDLFAAIAEVSGGGGGGGDATAANQATIIAAVKSGTSPNEKTAVGLADDINTNLGDSTSTDSSPTTLWGKVKQVYNYLSTTIAGILGTPASSHTIAGDAGSAATDAAEANTKLGTLTSGQSVYGDMAKEAAATANKNQVINAIGDTLSVNMLATGLSAMAGVPMNVITDDGTTAYTLNANRLYYFNNRSSDLELTLNLGTVTQGEAADFHLIVQVDTSASPLTVTIKDSNNNDVVWSWDSAPDFSAGVIYEIGIINNLALYVNYVV